MPKVSVIIPTYNRRHLVTTAIASVMNQTWDDFELIVIDDGSTDETSSLEILHEGDDRLTYIRLDENCGVSKARNTGVEHSKGQWLAFLDSDDLWHPRKLVKQMSWIHRNPQMHIMQTREIWIRNGKRVNPPRTHQKIAGDLFAISLKRCMITPSSVIMRRDLFEQTGGFNELLPVCEDYDLWLRVTCRHHVGLLDEDLLTRYGGHPDQLSASAPVLDRYRIISLQSLLRSGILSQDQSCLAQKTLVEKAKIVAEGARKRGDFKNYDEYIRIAGTC